MHLGDSGRQSHLDKVLVHTCTVHESGPMVFPDSWGARGVRGAVKIAFFKFYHIPG